MTDPQEEQLPAYALAWESAVGTSWKMTDGVAALINMKAWAGEHKKPRWRLVDPAMVEYWQPPANILDLRWSRSHPPARPWRRWDMRAAYLNAMAQVQLPYRQLRATGPGVDGTAVGYYQVRMTLGQTHQLWLPRPDRKGCLWVTHDEMPTVRLGAHEIIDSWTSDDSGRILRNWAEHWRDVIEANPRLRQPLKMGYAQAVGLMGAKTQGVYRPDWRHFIIGFVRQSMRRRILAAERATGLQPVRIDVDSIWYDDAATLDHPATMLGLTAALGVGDRIGQLRYEGIEP